MIIQNVAHQIKTARPRRQRGETVIPALAFQFRLERVHPNWNDQAADNAKARAFRIPVFGASPGGPVRDDSLDVPFIGIKQEAHQRLFVIRIAAGVGFDEHAQTIDRRRSVALASAA